MSLLRAESVCIFSSMQGKLTFNGEPASGAKITRKVTWKGKKEETDSTSAGDNGEFTFEVMNRELKRFFPAEFVAYQKIIVDYQGEQYLIWEMAKRETSEFGELGGKLVNFRCELTNEPDGADVPRGLLLTSCKWDGIEK